MFSMVPLEAVTSIACIYNIAYIPVFNDLILKIHIMYPTKVAKALQRNLVMPLRAQVKSLAWPVKLFCDGDVDGSALLPSPKAQLQVL